MALLTRWRYEPVWQAVGLSAVVAKHQHDEHSHFICNNLPSVAILKVLLDNQQMLKCWTQILHTVSTVQHLPMVYWWKLFFGIRGWCGQTKSDSRAKLANIKETPAVNIRWGRKQHVRVIMEVGISGKGSCSILWQLKQVKVIWGQWRFMYGEQVTYRGSWQVESLENWEASS